MILHAIREMKHEAGKICVWINKYISCVIRE